MKRNALPSGPVDGAVHRVELERARRSASAVTISGLAMNDSVAALPSLRPGKLRLKEETMVLALLAADVGALPLADARAAGVGEHGAADLLEGRHDAVALDGLVDLLRARRDQERRLAP